MNQKATTHYCIMWRPKAGDDLRSIIRYIGKDNPSRARTFGKELRDKTQLLARHPESGRAGRPGLPNYVRELIARPNYIIFYRILAEDRIIEILRVKHAAQHFTQKIVRNTLHSEFV